MMMRNFKHSFQGLLASIQQRRRPTQLLTLTVILLVLVMTAMWATVWALLQEQKRQVVGAEYRQNANIARVLQEQTVRVVSAVDQAIIRLANAAQAGTVAPEEHQRIVDATGLSAAILPQLSLIDAHGLFLGSNVDPNAQRAGRVDLSKRDHVKIHLNPQSKAHDTPILTGSGLYVGPPVLGKVSNKWTVQLSRAVRDVDGTVTGVVVGSIDTRYLEDVYRQVALGAQGGVSLVGADGILRARVIGGETSGIGTTVGNSSRILRKALGQSGQWIFISGVDGVERITAYQKVADYPLYVFAVSGLQESLAPWRATRNLVAGLASLLSVLLCTMGWLVVRAVNRLESQHRALQLSEAQAQSASEAKTQFLAAISHEIRTPLTSIRGFAELLERRAQDEPVKNTATFIRQGAERLNTLLTEIIDLSQVETGTMVFNEQEHVLKSLVDETTNPFRIRAQEKGLEFELLYQRGLPEIIWTDATRLRQVISNLLSNAVKFTKEGKVTVQVSTDDTFWSLTVTDSGPGIPLELHEQVFEKFRQADGRVSYEHGGTGLGLTLARSIARRLGGDVRLDPSVPAGCQVTARLPVAAQRSEQEQRPPSAAVSI